MKKYQTKPYTIYCGDNLKMLLEIPDSSIDLIYIDPPFNSNRNYEVFWGDSAEKRAFNDRFGDAAAYIDYMKPRLLEMYRVLKDTGSFYFHCDWHASHYVKVTLDDLFGFNNFQNEIIWKRTNIHNDAKNRMPIITDSIFYYTKSGNYTFNPIYQPHNPDYVKNFYRHDDNDGRGPYQLADMASPNPRPNMMYNWMGFNYPEKGWRYQLETMRELHEQSRIYYPKKKNGEFDFAKRPRIKRYLNEQKGTLISNIWDDIQNVQAVSKESLGYPTQKPLALLERIVTISSNKGDVVLDAFCGCGTTLTAAHKLNRKWIGIDISPTACRVMADRLDSAFKLREGIDFTVEDLPRNEEELRMLPHFEFQNWAVIALGGIPNKRLSGDFGIDGKLYPVEKERSKESGFNLFGESDVYYPIQVKQKDKVGRPDIDSFQTAIKRDKRKRGYFIGFSFSKDAIEEIKRLDKEGDIEIIPVTVSTLINV